MGWNPTGELHRRTRKMLPMFGVITLITPKAVGVTGSRHPSKPRPSAALGQESPVYPWRRASSRRRAFSPADVTATDAFTATSGVTEEDAAASCEEVSFASAEPGEARVIGLGETAPPADRSWRPLTSAPSGARGT